MSSDKCIWITTRGFQCSKDGRINNLCGLHHKEFSKRTFDNTHTPDSQRCDVIMRCTNRCPNHISNNDTKCGVHNGTIKVHKEDECGSKAETKTKKSIDKKLKNYNKCERESCENKVYGDSKVCHEHFTGEDIELGSFKFEVPEPVNKTISTPISTSKFYLFTTPPKIDVESVNSISTTRSLCKSCCKHFRIIETEVNPE